MRPRKRGFTLIELLVVVAIIALLISILLPSLKQAREQARTTVCSSHLHQIGVAIQTYAADAKGWIPPFYYRGATAGGETVTSFGNGINSGGPGLLIRQPVGWGMAAYLPNTDPFFCPVDEVLAPHRWKDQWAPDRPVSYGLDPTGFTSINGYTSYWYIYVNETGQDSGDIQADKPGFYDGFQRHRLDQIRLVRGDARGNKLSSVSIMSDLGELGIWSLFYPLTHRTGWNVLKTDASVSFVHKKVADRTFKATEDVWMQTMMQFDRR